MKTQTATLNTLAEAFKAHDSKLTLKFDLGVMTARLHKDTPKAKWSAYKTVFAYRFETIEIMIEFIQGEYEKMIERKKANDAYKAEKKERERKERESVEAGDLFVSSWGYEQTNVDFYQVISRPSAAYAIVRPVSYEQIETTSWASEYVRPVKDAFVGEEMRVKLNGSSFKTGHSQHARKIENPETSKHYHSWYA